MTGEARRVTIVDAAALVNDPKWMAGPGSTIMTIGIPVCPPANST